MKGLLHILLTLLCVSAFSQEYKHEPMRCGGPIPDDFRTLSSVKFKQGKDSLLTEKSNIRQEEFLLESSFLIDNVLNSGQVIFNHPVTDYLSKILDEILKNEPLTREKVRIYALRSSSVNAFTTSDGIILVNIGLLAQLENEAQLAYVLCHELVHFTQKHAMSAYMSANLAQKRGSLLKKNEFNAQILNRSAYSKEAELEADSIGLQMFSKTGYATSAVSQVFDMMRYAHVPFDDMRFPIAKFNQGNYILDPSYELPKVRTIEPVQDDEETSHPATGERKTRAVIQLANLPTGGELFRVSSSDFHVVRKMCRVELVGVLNDEGDPTGAIYLHHLSELQNPIDPYLAYQEGRSLYTLTKYKNAGAFGSIHPGWSIQQGEKQQVYHLFYRLQPDELNVLAVRELYRLTRAFNGDESLKSMYHDAVTDLVKYHGRPGLFEKRLPAAVNGTPFENDDRYERIERKALNDPRKWMVTYGLVDLFEDPDFSSLFDSLLVKFHLKTGENTTISKKKRPTSQNHFAVGLDHAIVISPVYQKFDMRKRQRNRFILSEEARIELKAKIVKMAKSTDIKLTLLDAPDLGPNDIDKYNDLVFLNNWSERRYREIEVGMVNISQPELEELAKRYGSEHFVWTGVITYRESKPLRFFHLLYMLLPPTIPFALYHVIRPIHDTHFFFVTFNIVTGNPEMVAYKNIEMRDSQDYINAYLYDAFLQLATKPKAAVK